MERRIAPPSDANSRKVIAQLTEVQGNLDYSIFDTKQKLMVFAAALAFFRGGKSKSFVRDAGNAVRFDIFEKAADDTFVRAMGVAALGNLGILSEERADELIAGFEAHVHAGLLELERECFTSGKDPLDALLEIIDDCRVDAGDEIPGVDQSVLRRLMQG